jgi:hypothetical protein
MAVHSVGDVTHVSGLCVEPELPPCLPLNTVVRSQAVLGLAPLPTTSAIWGNSENIYSLRVLPPLTQSGKSLHPWNSDRFLLSLRRFIENHLLAISLYLTSTPVTSWGARLQL